MGQKRVILKKQIVLQGHYKVSKVYCYKNLGFIYADLRENLIISDEDGVKSRIFSIELCLKKEVYICTVNAENVHDRKLNEHLEKIKFDLEPPEILQS